MEADKSGKVRIPSMNVRVPNLSFSYKHLTITYMPRYLI